MAGTFMTSRTIFVHERYRLSWAGALSSAWTIDSSLSGSCLGHMSAGSVRGGGVARRLLVWTATSEHLASEEVGDAQHLTSRAGRTN